MSVDQKAEYNKSLRGILREFQVQRFKEQFMHVHSLPTINAAQRAQYEEGPKQKNANQGELPEEVVRPAPRRRAARFLARMRSLPLPLADVARMHRVFRLLLAVSLSASRGSADDACSCHFAASRKRRKLGCGAIF